jgi:hypothetical protein
MVDVPKNRLQNRNGTWHFRAKVPIDLQEAFGKREEKKSLKTGSRTEARRIANALSLEFDAKIGFLRRQQFGSEKHGSVGIRMVNIRAWGSSRRHRRLHNNFMIVYHFRTTPRKPPERGQPQ